MTTAGKPFLKVFFFLETIKFEHSVFALPFAYLGLILAEAGMPRLFLWAWVTVAMVSFRTMAMGANRLMDADIDALNPRTRDRALPSGKLSRPFVLFLTGLSMAVFIVSAFLLGPVCFYLSPVPLILAWGYPLMKRFTWCSHGVLGIILGIAPYGAWLASRGAFSWIPGLLTLGVSAWVAGFDIIYAIQDLDVDQRLGLYSIPARWGPDRALEITRWLHLAAVLSWLGAGYLAGLGILFYLGMAAVVVFLLRQHRLIRCFGVGKIQQAFFTMNAAVSLILFFSVAADISFGG